MKYRLRYLIYDLHSHIVNTTVFTIYRYTKKLNMVVKIIFMSHQSIARFDHLAFFFQLEEAGSAQRTLADVCLRVAEPEANLRERNLLPTYDCLVLSPSNIWQGQQEVDIFIYRPAH